MTDDRVATSNAPGPEDPEAIAGAGIDTTVPHSARIWNYWLGGKDNCAVDREAGDQYVDALVLAHARALLTSTPQGATDYIDADMRDPAAVLAGAGATLDFGQPISLMIMGVMGHIPDDAEAQSIVRRLLAGLPSGSFLALYDSPDISEALNEAQQGYDDTGAVPYKLRCADQIGRFFEGLEFVTPGLVRCPEWRPEAGQAGGAPDVLTLAGVARKP